MAAPRERPNILVCGTPGTGKTTLCEQVAAESGLRHVNVGDVVKAQQLHNGWDDEFECLVIDEDKARGGGALGGGACRRCRRRHRQQPVPAGCCCSSLASL